MSKKNDSYYYAGYREGGLRDKKKIIIPIVIAAVVLIIAAAVCAYIFGYVIPHGKEIASIKVDTLPEKMEYYVTDKADFSGLKIGVTRNNGEYFVVDGSECKITGFDSSKPYIKQNITVNYANYTTNLYVNIKALPVFVPSLLKIEVTTLPKTEYMLGDRLDTTGGILTLYYTDGSEKRINLDNSNIYNFASVTEVGEYDLLVRHSEGGILCETTYKITVAANEAESGT